MCVTFLYKGSLLAQAVQSLFEGGADQSVVGVDLGEERAVERLHALQPSVVVVDADDVAFRSGELMRLLDPIPQFRLICLHGDGGYVDVFQKSRVAVHGSRDLTAAIGAA